MKSLESIIKRSNNNFDLVRLIAALMVIFFHSFYLFRNNHHPIPGSFILKDNSIGGIAVYIFFFLSGMFITSSFINSKGPFNFILLRVFRIWPALIVCMVLTVFVVGPIISKYSFIEYFGARGTWGYLMHGISLYHIQFILPGVFENNYYPLAINGSIWTLPLELLCYFLILVLGVARVFSNKIVLVVTYTIIFSLYVLNFHSIKIYLNTQFPFFIIGSLAYIFRKYIIVDYRILVLCLIVYCFYFEAIFLFTLVMYGALVFGSSSIFKKIKLPGDYSYGIYIYAFLVQQVTARYFIHLSAYNSLFITVPITVALASLSWHFIEYPSIQIAKKIVKRGEKNHHLSTTVLVKNS